MCDITRLDRFPMPVSPRSSCVRLLFSGGGDFCDRKVACGSQDL